MMLDQPFAALVAGLVFDVADRSCPSAGKHDLGVPHDRSGITQAPLDCGLRPTPDFVHPVRGQARHTSPWRIRTWGPQSVKSSSGPALRLAGFGQRRERGVDIAARGAAVGRAFVQERVVIRGVGVDPRDQRVPIGRT